MTIKLPKGVSVWIRGKKFVGEIPSELCPEKFKEGAQKKKVETKKAKENK